MTTAVPITRAPPAARAGAADVLRPFAVLAVIAFAIGVAGYVALGRPALAAPAEPPAAAAEPADAPAALPADDAWNPPRRT